MRTLKIAIAAIIALVSISINAQNTLRIKTNKASKQLVEVWIKAYMNINPEMCIILVDKDTEADLTLVNDIRDGGVTYVGRYAVAPFTSVENPLYGEVTKHQWSTKDIKKLFFQNEDDLIDELEEKSKSSKLYDRMTVYSGSSSSSVAGIYAQHFGYQKGDIKGKKIAGDDLYLNNAIAKDKQSVTFNNIAYLYDTQSRQLKQDIALLPLDVKKEMRETLASGNLDLTLDLLEQNKIESIAIENFGFAYSNFNSDIDKFLSWVISEGQQYNHQLGFLRLDEKEVKNQLKLLATR